MSTAVMNKVVQTANAVFRHSADRLATLYAEWLIPADFKDEQLPTDAQLELVPVTNDAAGHSLPEVGRHYVNNSHTPYTADEVEALHPKLSWDYRYCINAYIFVADRVSTAGDTAWARISGNGVFLKANVEGQNTLSSGYNFGSTLAHELGHNLSLQHPFDFSECSVHRQDSCEDTKQYILDQAHEIKRNYYRACDGQAFWSSNVMGGGRLESASFFQPVRWAVCSKL